MKLHQGHLGIDKCLKRAREICTWPGMSTDIIKLVKNCQTCMKFSPSQIAEPLQLRPIANRPWQNIGADLFDLGKKKFLIVTDYLSLYPEVISLTSSKPVTVTL